MSTFSKVSQLSTILFIILIILAIAAQKPAYAQINSTPLTSQANSPDRKADSTVKEIDAIDLARKVFRIKTPAKDSVKYVPGKVYVSAIPGVGYAILTGFTAVTTGNFAFYTGSSTNENISAIQANLEYSQNNQFIPYIISNIWTKDNKYNILGDYRYFKYSMYTYGLGGNSPTDNPDYFYYNFVRIYQMVLKQVFPDLLIGPGYNLDYHWDIAEDPAFANLIPKSENDYYRYGSPSTTISSGLSVNLLYDTRRNQINPIGGSSYVNVIFRDNFQFMGSDQNWSSLYADFRKYIEWPRGSKNILALWNYEWLTTSGKPPYFDLPSTGWDTYQNAGREYIQGRYRGLDYLYMEAEYRFNISRNRMFGAAFFANIESASDWPSNSFKTFVPGGGATLRIKVNKHSDTFFVVGYGWGVNGQSGLCFNLGEYF